MISLIIIVFLTFYFTDAQSSKSFRITNRLKTEPSGENENYILMHSGGKHVILSEVNVPPGHAEYFLWKYYGR